MDIPNIAADLKRRIREDGHLPVALRAARLKSLRKTIQRDEVRIGKALKEDLGKSHFESYAFEIGIILEDIRFTLKHLERWARPRRVPTSLALLPGSSYIYPEPYGVVLNISPWNYPFQLSLAPAIGAVAAGNRVVLKPSEFTPATSAIIKSLIEEVFSPTEAVVIEGAVEETEMLLKQHFDYIFFTGSIGVGKVVMRAAAEHLTPVTLELGGKSPFLIEESADIDLAAKRCAWGKFVNAGQTCVAPDYVLVPRRLQASFIERIAVHITDFYGANPETSADYSRIVNDRHFDRLKNLLVTEKIAIGGNENSRQKYIPPTVMKDVSWNDRVMENEIFGPILPVLPYDRLDDAIDEILKNSKPLALYLFSNDSGRIQDIITKIPFGGGCVNDAVVHPANPHLPFGGIGASGMGSYHGEKSFSTFTHYKSIYRQFTRIDLPIRYPPYAGKLRWLKFFLR